MIRQRHLITEPTEAQSTQRKSWLGIMTSPIIRVERAATCSVSFCVALCPLCLCGLCDETQWVTPTRVCSISVGGPTVCRGRCGASLIFAAVWAIAPGRGPGVSRCESPPTGLCRKQPAGASPGPAPRSHRLGTRSCLSPAPASRIRPDAAPETSMPGGGGTRRWVDRGSIVTAGDN